MRFVIVPLVTRVLGHQRAGRELVRRAGAAQCGEHVELPRLEVVRLERGAACTVEVTGQPGDAREHVERRDVEVGSFARPRRDDRVDLVPPRACRQPSRRVMTPARWS